MGDCVFLERTQTLADRQFTDPAHTAVDLSWLSLMANQLRDLCRRPEGLAEEPRPLILHLREVAGRQHRVVMARREALLEGVDLTVVGFFGHKDRALDHTLLEAVDQELIGEFLHHPGVLSYSSLELENGDYGNLVLLNPPEAKEHWRTSQKHIYAAQELSPRHYLHIRLHNGYLPGGLQSGRDPVLQRTKYYDYRGGEVWRGVRELV
jgi:hypothetical protein